MVQKADSFSHADLGVAAGLTRREVQFVADAKDANNVSLLPSGSDIRALKRIAVIGGWVSAGVPLLVAAKVSAQIPEEFSETDGEVPSGLKYLARDLPKEVQGELPNPANDYWYHRALFAHPDIYPRGSALQNDVRLLVADRRYLFRVAPDNLKLRNPWTGEREAFSFIGWIDGWSRAGDVRLEQFVERFPFDLVDPGHLASARRANHEVQKFRQNAVGFTTVNISLAVRNGLDRLAEDRADYIPNPNWKPGRQTASLLQDGPIDADAEMRAALAAIKKPSRRKTKA